MSLFEIRSCILALASVGSIALSASACQVPTDVGPTEFEPPGSESSGGAVDPPGGTSGGPDASTTGSSEQGSDSSTSTAGGSDGSGSEGGTALPEDPCTPGELGVCPDEAPVCDESSQCVPCTEHDQCGDGLACHLGGFFQGTCFSSDDVQVVTNGEELSLAISNVQTTSPESQHLVLDLQGDDFAFEDALLRAGPGVAEVAIIGDGTQVLTGDSDFALFPTYDSTILYLHGVTLTNNGGSGVHCSGKELWIDDARVVGNTRNGVRADSSCSTTIRRSVLAISQSSQDALVSYEGLIDLIPGERPFLPPSLRIENSFLFGVSGFSAAEAIAVSSDIEASIVASTVVGSVRFLNPPPFSDEPDQRLELRNSIVLSRLEPVDHDFSPISSVAEFVALHNAFDNIPAHWESNAGLGLPEFQFEDNVDVGHIDPAWFEDAVNADFHLAPGHPFDGVAERVEGDPTTDIDGDARVAPGDTEPAGADVP